VDLHPKVSYAEEIYVNVPGYFLQIYACLALDLQESP